jgi:hypothetical protein
MTNDEIKAFYREIGAVCSKYKISGVAGVWFSGNGHDEFGQMLYWDIADSRMKLIIEDLSQKYSYWAKHTLGHISRPLGPIREIIRKDSETN